MTPTTSSTSLRVQAALGALTLLVSLAASNTVRAEDKKDAVVKPLLTQDLVGIPGKEVSMVTVEYPPGGASAPHRHDANVFVYVLEGSLIMQVQGKEPVTLTPGQTFHETPTDIHAKSANASTTKPAKFLAIVVKDKGAPVTRPVEPEKAK